MSDSRVFTCLHDLIDHLAEVGAMIEIPRGAVRLAGEVKTGNLRFRDSGIAQVQGNVIGNGRRPGAYDPTSPPI